MPAALAARFGVTPPRGVGRGRKLRQLHGVRGGRIGQPRGGLQELDVFAAARIAVGEMGLEGRSLAG